MSYILQTADAPTASAVSTSHRRITDINIDGAMKQWLAIRSAKFHRFEKNRLEIYKLFDATLQIKWHQQSNLESNVRLNRQCANCKEMYDLFVFSFYE